MNNTALILRDPKTKPVRTLETDGPNRRYDPIINYTARSNLGLMSSEEFTALPSHDKHIENPYSLDYAAAIRIHSLLLNARKDGVLQERHIRELIWRMRILHPGCEDGGTPYQFNDH